MPVRTIVTSPLFGFYRPAAFLLVKAEWWAFAWRHPAGYLAVSLALHFVSAALVFWLLRRFGVSAFAAVAGAALFAASPWSSEAFFWLSGCFDVLSAFGTVACLSAIVSISAHDSTRRAVLLGTAGVGAAGVAILSKENVVLALPVLAVALTLAREGIRAPRARWGSVAAVAVLVAAYLPWRSRLLPELGGAYGSAASLFAQAPIASNAFGYVRAFVTVPLPFVRVGAPLGQPAMGLIAAAALLMTVFAWRRHRGLAAASLAGFAAAIAPTLWLAPIPFATQTGRFMYLPGLCGCLLFAGAIDFLAGRGRAVRMAGTALAGAVLLAAAGSVRHQASMWSRATSLAREAVEQVRPLARSSAAGIFIPNLPFWFAAGPYVLKDYAFAYYFGSVPPVRTRNMTLDIQQERTHFAGWVAGSGLPEEVPPSPPGPGEHVLTLRLAVADVPRAELHPSRISVFASLDARRASDVRVAMSAMSAQTAWRAEPSDPAVLSVEPARGTGPASLRIVPLARDAPIDRVMPVAIRADEADGAVLATLTVRVRVGPVVDAAPPFGSLDAPAAATISAQEPGLIFQGWALDDFSLRRVYGEARDAAGARVPLGDAIRDGERPDVSQAFPNAHDLYSARWTLQIDAARLAPLRTPITVEIVAEDADGLKTRLGVRTIR
jgi:hypothetical protein